MKNYASRKYWNKIGANYSKSWKSYGKKKINENEMGFIVKHLEYANQNSLLDLGIGNGRILNILSENTEITSKIYGLDVSPVMIKICKEKFKNSLKIKELKVCDIANENIFFDNEFDFITAVRVLKYNGNWGLIIKKAYNHLADDGVFVFTMLNSRSINRFSRNSPIPIYRTNIENLKKILTKTGFKILETKSFSKLPDFFYDNSKNRITAMLVILSEKLLEIIFGKVFLGRILFIAAKK